MNGDGGRFHRDRFLRAADFQLEVNTRVVADVQHYALLLAGFETFGFSTDNVMSNMQVGSRVLAIAASAHSGGDVRIGIGERHLDTRNRSSRRVSDRSHDGCLLTKRAESAGKEKQKENRAMKSVALHSIPAIPFKNSQQAAHHVRSSSDC